MMSIDFPRSSATGLSTEKVMIIIIKRCNGFYKLMLMFHSEHAVLLGCPTPALGKMIKCINEHQQMVFQKFVKLGDQPRRHSEILGINFTR